MLSAADSDVIKIVDFGLSKRINKRVVCMQGAPEFVRKLKFSPYYYMIDKLVKLFILIRLRLKLL